jgi:predicted transcriptional regulator
MWKEKLGPSRAAIFQKIEAAEPAVISREELARSLGKSHTTGTFKQDLRDMQSYGLIEFAEGGVRVAESFAALVR